MVARGLKLFVLLSFATLALAVQPPESKAGVSSVKTSLLGSARRRKDCDAGDGADLARPDHVALATPPAVDAQLTLLVGSLLVLVANTGVAGAAAAAPNAVSITFREILAKASKKALSGGLAGSIAGVIQVLTLMWMRTTMNYQYRYGTSTREALATLYKQGGIGRFYQGLPFALLQTPLSRFGDTAAQTGVLAVFAMTAPAMNVGITTAVASAAGSLWRIALTPIDTLKTTLQVEGKAALAQVANKVKANGILVLYQGAIANAVASFVGSYPWYFTFNLLRQLLPNAPVGVLYLKLLRNAAAGFGATCVSDCVSNVIRVLKTAVQTAPEPITYVEAARMIIESDGILGLFARGLGTRLLTNGLQASIFSVLWKILEERFTK
eukprot:4245834-Prymnesium_polylepis.1